MFDFDENSIMKAMQFILNAGAIEGECKEVTEPENLLCLENITTNTVVRTDLVNGGWEERTIDPNGNELIYRNSDGKYGEYTYFSDRKPLTYKNNEGLWHEWTYDDKGNQLTYKNSDGYSCEKTYDEKGNELTFKDSAGYWEERTYDDDGEEITYKDSTGIERKFNCAVAQASDKVSIDVIAIAKKCYEIWAGIHASLGNLPHLFEWHELPDFPRQYVIDSVNFYLADSSLTLEEKHAKHIDTMISDGWTKGESDFDCDFDDKIFPYLIPFHELPEHRVHYEALIKSVTDNELGRNIHTLPN